MEVDDGVVNNYEEIRGFFKDKLLEMTGIKGLVG